MDVRVSINRNTGIAVVMDMSGNILASYSAYAVEAIVGIIQKIDQSASLSLDAMAIVGQV